MRIFKEIDARMKLLSCIVFLFSASVYAQEVIGAAGTISSNGTHSLEWTIGESLTSTESNGTNTITQGFHQTMLTVSSIEEEGATFNVSAFPNPTNSILNVNITNCDEELNVQLYDVAGKLVKSIRYAAGQQTSLINFEKYERGTYYIKVSSMEEVSTITVVKQ